MLNSTFLVMESNISIQWMTDKFLTWMCASDNKNEMAKNLEILKMYLPLHGLCQRGLHWLAGVLMTLKSTERETGLGTSIMSRFYWSSNFAGQWHQGAHLMLLVMSDVGYIGHQQERRSPLQLYGLKLLNFSKLCWVLYCIFFRPQKNIFASCWGQA